MNNNLTISQNFIKNKTLLGRILKKINLPSDYIVIDIGAGEGAISKALIEMGYKVLAFELDKDLYENLKKDIFSKNLSILNQDFLKFDFNKLDTINMNIFSNIPFNLTTEIIQKILIKDVIAQDVYLIMQEEAANRFLGKKEGLFQSLLIFNNYTSEIIYKFKRTDFNPVPKVNIVLIKFKKREKALIEPKDYSLFLDFITYIIMQQKPTIIDRLSKVLNYYSLKDFLFLLKIDPYKTLYEIPKIKYFETFNLFIEKFPSRINVFKNSYQNYVRINKSNKKVFKTRTK